MKRTSAFSLIVTAISILSLISCKKDVIAFNNPADNQSSYKSIITADKGIQYAMKKPGFWPQIDTTKVKNP